MYVYKKDHTMVIGNIHYSHGQVCAQDEVWKGVAKPPGSFEVDSSGQSFPIYLKL